MRRTGVVSAGLAAARSMNCCDSRTVEVEETREDFRELLEDV
jgi:hypothetical protein